MNTNPGANVVTIKKQDLDQLQAIAEAAARAADELGHPSGAENIRNINRNVDAFTGRSQEGWDNFGVVNEWSSEIKGGAANPIRH